MIIYRLLTGPYDIPAIATSTVLGNRALEVAPLSRRNRNTFALRVNDNASGATARAEFSLGEAQLRIVRNLSDLSLVSVDIDGVPLDELNEANYQTAVCKRARLANFGDWILVLRHLVFYFEDRRSLVWDPTAQRELLRLLFLDIDDTKTWNSKWRAILERDSLVRNLGYAFRREESALARISQSMSSGDEIRQELGLLENLQEEEAHRLEKLEGEIADAEAARQQARVRALAAEQDHEAAVRAVEQYQLNTISAAFPPASETAKYLLGQILAEHKCRACGSDVPHFVATLESRIHDGECVICGSAVGRHTGDEANVNALVAQALKRLEIAERHSTASSEQRLQALSNGQVEKPSTAIPRLNKGWRSMSEVFGRIRPELARFPPDAVEGRA